MADTYEATRGEYYMQISAGPYVRPQPFNGVAWAPKKFFKLPLPGELRDDTGANYTNIDLNSVGDFINGNLGSGAVAAGLRFSGQGLSAIGSLGAELLGSIPTSSKVGTALSSAVTSAAGELFPADQITSAIQQATGLAPNPNPSVAFQGPQLREFSFTWTFFPRTRSDSMRVHSLIKTLKQIALPENAVSESGAVLKYPWLVRLNFFPWDDMGKPNGWTDDSIVRYKKCFMSAVNVNYNPSNVPAFFKGENGRAGMPVAIQLTIAFKEVEYFLAKDYGGGSGQNLASVLGSAAGSLGEGFLKLFGDGTDTQNVPNPGPQDNAQDAIP